MIGIQNVTANGKKRQAIIITRGDCGILDVDISNGDEQFEMSTDDTIELTVRQKPRSDSPVLLHSVSAPGVPQIIFHKEDTQIPPGKYSADIQLNHGNCRYTVWPGIDVDADTDDKANRGNFIVLTEVTMDE